MAIEAIAADIDGTITDETKNKFKDEFGSVTEVVHNNVNEDTNYIGNNRHNPHSHIKNFTALFLVFWILNGKKYANPVC